MKGFISNENNRSRDALTIPEHELRLLLDTIPTLVWRAGPEGNVEYVNRRALEYFGAPLGDIIGHGWAEKVHPEDVAFKVSTWLKSLETENPHDVICRFRGADSRYRWFNVRGEPLRASDGTVLGWYGVLIDIEDRTRALARLEQMQSDFAHVNRVSMMGELAASLSHEITQPIASARNNARAAQNFLDMQPPDLSEVREALSCVVGDAGRARRHRRPHPRSHQEDATANGAV
jgi:PAS domain S-box-containing protein